MKTFLLKTSESTEIWELEPDHFPSLLRREYRFLLSEGASKRAARWHIHRMLTFLDNPLGGWTATQVEKRDAVTEVTIFPDGREERCVIFPDGREERCVIFPDGRKDI